MNPRFALFGEVLLTGVLVTLASLGLITALPAAIAGAGHLRRHINGEGGSTVYADFRAALAGLPGLSAGLPLLAAVLTWNLTAGRQAGPVAFTASLLVAALGAITVVRLAGSWRPGSVFAFRSSLRQTVSDPVGSALIAGALLGAVAVGWMLPPLALVTPGLLLLAALAVNRRQMPAEAGGGTGP
ncbi:hypothetical protein [Actinoplanes sp. NBRC 101535]|uniref:hypothetical protein n=1 Tax=Actinoplanes sp. NBRC 101535 TaxID=3032196 RepID=UPI0024A4F1AC|nr:hypothetical protein [Actinoplanes sp. NBRC 101535]GLY07859.1 hypothetical protein Acsp01_82380 [Actinoplanes sp. NBRC 101535]